MMIDNIIIDSARRVLNLECISKMAHIEYHDGQTFCPSGPGLRGL